MTTLRKLFADGRNLDDWLSPILVKELREGMRGRAFVLPFLLVQVFLIVLVLANLAAMGDHNALESQNWILWVILGFALLALMPLRGLVAISQEVRRQTLETILLTRLTAWRIVLGKWSALFAQSLLLTTAVLPYIVLRYFVGGDDIVSDFEALFFMLWLSGILIAASIAVSGVTNGVVRILLLITGIGVALTVSDGFSSSPFPRMDFWAAVAYLAVCSLFIPALLFELSASAIAPVSENHAARRRVCAVVFFGLVALMNWKWKDLLPVMSYLSLIALVGICYYELSEKPRLLPRLVQPWVRFGPLGPFIGRFLLPGWPSALLFSIIVIPFAVAIHYVMAFDDYADFHFFSLGLYIFAFLGSILVPILLCHLFWPKMNQVFFMVLLYNLILMGLSSVLKEFASLTQVKIDNVMAFTPGLPVFLFNQDDTPPNAVMEWYTLGNIITLSIVLLILLIASRRYFHDLGALYRSCRKKPDDPVPSDAGGIEPGTTAS